MKKDLHQKLIQGMDNQSRMLNEKLCELAQRIK